MENKLAELYDKLAEQIVETIPVEWDKIYFLGDVDKNLHMSANFFFYDTEKERMIASGNIPSEYDVSEEVYDELMDEIANTVLEIYDCFIQNNQEPWDFLSLFLDEEGKFKVEYLYDIKHDNDGGSYVRLLVWAHNTFGFVPEEGSYGKDLLDAYFAYQEKGDTSIDFWKFKKILRRISKLCLGF